MQSTAIRPRRHARSSASTSAQIRCQRSQSPSQWPAKRHCNRLGQLHCTKSKIGSKTCIIADPLPNGRQRSFLDIAKEKFRTQAVCERPYLQCSRLHQVVRTRKLYLQRFELLKSTRDAAESNSRV